MGRRINVRREATNAPRLDSQILLYTGDDAAVQQYIVHVVFPPRADAR